MPLHIVISKNKIISHHYDEDNPDQLDRDAFNSIKDMIDPSNSLRYRREYSKLYGKKYRENKKEIEDSMKKDLSTLVTKLNIEEEEDTFSTVHNETNEIILKMWQASKNKKMIQINQQ